MYIQVYIYKSMFISLVLDSRVRGNDGIPGNSGFHGNNGYGTIFTFFMSSSKIKKVPTSPAGVGKSRLSDEVTLESMTQGIHIKQDYLGQRFERKFTQAEGGLLSDVNLFAEADQGKIFRHISGVGYGADHAAHEHGQFAAKGESESGSAPFFHTTAGLHKMFEKAAPLLV